MRRSLIIALEGLDGAGKTTLGAALAALLIQSGYRVEARHTPGPKAAPLAFHFRPQRSLASFMAFTLGNLEAAEAATGDCDVLVIDRYMLSTLVHHASVLEDGDATWLGRLGAPRPLVTLFLDVPPEMASARLAARVGDRPLLIGLEQQRAAYLELAMKPAWRHVVGDVVVMPHETPAHSAAAVALVIERVRDRLGPADGRPEGA